MSRANKQYLHMIPPKMPKGERLRRWNLLSKLFCLLAALAFWLLIFQIRTDSRESEGAEESKTLSDTVHQEEVWVSAI